MEAAPEVKDRAYYVKRTIGFILLLALSFTFLYSAYTKSGIVFNGNILADARQAVKTSGHWWMYVVGFFSNVFVETPLTANAFDSFQWTFVDLGINSIVVAGFIARLMIGLELLLGLFLLFHIFLKKFTYRAVITILSVFIVYLIFVIMKQGNTGNCGCFGNSLSMTPLQAIWKNVAMIAVTVVLMFIYPVKAYAYQEYICLVIALVGFSMPFVANPVYVGTEPVVYKDKQVNFDLLYKYSPAPDVDLRKGKHIIAFMSLTCPHCKKAAYLLHIIHHQHPDIPIYLVLDGPEAKKKEFFDETHAENVPYLYYRHTEDFMQMSGPGVPSIYWVNNGVIELKSVYAYYQLDPKYMEEWLKKK